MTRVQPNIKRHGTLVKKNPRDPDEVWKPTTISDKYDVSSYGRVRNAKRGNVLRQTTKPRGYKTLNFLGKTYYVHQLMALSFIGEPEKDQTVDHIDRKPYNNHISNLRWASKKEQSMNRGTYTTKGSRILCVETKTSNQIEFISIKRAAYYMKSFSSLSLATICHKIAKFANKDEELMGRKWTFIDTPTGEVRPLTSFPGYNVSSCGLIQGLYGKWTRGTFFDGYMTVVMDLKSRLVHRMVAETFLDTPDDDKIIVNHKNGKKDDNRVVNLEYVTHSENMQHALMTGLKKVSKVLRICKDSGNILQEHESLKHASTFIGLKSCSSSISRCCLGKAATAYNFRWSYPGESEKYSHLVKPPRKILRICRVTDKILQEHESINDASEFIRDNVSCDIGGDIKKTIIACCMRRQISTHGYKWSYVGEESTHQYSKTGKPVLQICKETGSILNRFKSQGQAAIYVNGHSGSISSCCYGKTKTASGYKWRFE